MGSHELFVEQKFTEASKFVKENSKVLDIGCYNGKLKEFLKNPEYYGIDIDKKMIFNLTKKGINAKQADLNKDSLPFKNERFDYIFLMDVLEHVVDPRSLIMESKKRLKTGGRLIVTLPNDYHILNKVRFLFNKHLTEDPFAPFGHLHYFPIKSGEKFLASCGLKIIKRVNLAPVKPKIIPGFIKKFLTNVFPQSFARDMLYLVD